MKRTDKCLRLFLIIACYLIGISAAPVDDEDKKYSGKDRISCKIEGKLYKAARSVNTDDGSNSFTVCKIAEVDGVSSLLVCFYFGDRYIKMVFPNTSAADLDDAEYSLKLKNGRNNYAEYKRKEDLIYCTTETQKGELIVDYYDPETKIIGGTFWFDSVNDKGHVIKITEGKFDMTLR